MKVATAVLALAAGVNAYTNITYVTEVVTALTTYCPAATEITHGGEVYTVTEATTLTITNCPCTITKPVTTISSVSCTSCYSNSTVAVAPTAASPTTTPLFTTTSTPVVAGAGKVMALSGAGLAGVLAIAAFVL